MSSLKSAISAKDNGLKGSHTEIALNWEPLVKAIKINHLDKKLDRYFDKKRRLVYGSRTSAKSKARQLAVQQAAVSQSSDLERPYLLVETNGKKVPGKQKMMSRTKAFTLNKTLVPLGLQWIQAIY